MVSEDAQTPFSVIGPQKDLPNGLRIYKLFSKQPLASDTVAAIFANLTVLASRQVVRIQAMVLVTDIMVVQGCDWMTLFSGFRACVKSFISKKEFLFCPMTHDQGTARTCTEQ